MFAFLQNLFGKRRLALPLPAATSVDTHRPIAAQRHVNTEDSGPGAMAELESRMHRAIDAGNSSVSAGKEELTKFAEDHGAHLINGASSRKTKFSFNTEEFAYLRTKRFDPKLMKDIDKTA